MGTLARARAGCTSTLVYRKRLLLLHLQAARKSGGQSERQRGALGGGGRRAGRPENADNPAARMRAAESLPLAPLSSVFPVPPPDFWVPSPSPFLLSWGAAVGAVPRGLGRRREGSAAQTRLHKGRARPASAPFTEKCVLFMKATPRHRGPGTATLSRRRARAAPRRCDSDGSDSAWCRARRQQRRTNTLWPDGPPESRTRGDPPCTVPLRRRADSPTCHFKREAPRCARVRGTHSELSFPCKAACREDRSCSPPETSCAASGHPTQTLTRGFGTSCVTGMRGPGLGYFPRHLFTGKRLDILEFLLPLVYS